MKIIAVSQPVTWKLEFFIFLTVYHSKNTFEFFLNNFRWIHRIYRSMTKYRSSILTGGNGAFPKCLHWIRWIFLITVERFEPVTSCVRDQGSTVPARHMWETLFLNWAQSMLQRFIRFPKFAEFTRIFRHEPYSVRSGNVV